MSLISGAVRKFLDSSQAARKALFARAGLYFSEAGLRIKTKAGVPVGWQPVVRCETFPENKTSRNHHTLVVYKSATRTLLRINAINQSGHARPGSTS